MNARERIAHLKGMIEATPGLANEHRRLFEAMAASMEAIDAEIESQEKAAALLRADVEELSEFQDELEDDIRKLEERLENENVCCCLDEENAEEGGFAKATCEHCGLVFPYDPDAYEEEEDLVCPGCGKSVGRDGQ